jgi:primosomal protein N' (replication factor Y)
MVSEIKSGNFSMFSQEFKEQFLALVNHSDKSKKILIFSPRRGHSGVLVCQNCGFAVKCKNCSTAYRVHKTTDLILMCHHCLRNIKIPEKCPNCSSFKLKTVGPVGTQKIYEEVQRILTINNAKIPVLILDADVIKNETEEEEILQEMKSPKTSIIISTQMIFSHRYDIKFDLIGVLNTDSIISAPDFKTEERLFYQVEKLLDFLPTNNSSKSKNIILQTYNPENKAITTASERNYKDFYEKELEIRKIFSYPPYSRLIKLTFKHRDQNRALYQARILSEKLKMVLWQLQLGDKVKLIDSYPSYIEKERGLFVYNIVLKILPELEDFRDILKFVPSNWSIDVDPRTII